MIYRNYMIAANYTHITSVSPLKRHQTWNTPAPLCHNCIQRIHFAAKNLHPQVEISEMVTPFVETTIPAEVPNKLKSQLPPFFFNAPGLWKRVKNDFKVL